MSKVTIISRPTRIEIRSKGVQGKPGPDAYAVAVADGYEGTRAEWLASLVGPQGDSAYQAWLDAGNTGTEADFLAALKGGKGDDGDSAYQVAVDAGFEGTEAEWLASLRGDDGTNATITTYTDEAAFDAANPGPLELAVLTDG